MMAQSTKERKKWTSQFSLEAWLVSMPCRRDCYRILSSAGPRQTCTQGKTLLFRPSAQQPPLTTQEVKPLSVTVIWRERERGGKRPKWTCWGKTEERERVKRKGTREKEVVREEMRIQMNLLHPTDRLSGSLSLSLSFSLSLSLCLSVSLSLSLPVCVWVLPPNWNAMRCETPL